jgi:MazG family protein
MRNIDNLLEIMIALRDPNSGCPWDLEQDFATIAPYTVEEAYEVADAIEREDMDDLRTELGDLLLQVVFHSQIAAERQLFTFHDVVRGISEKLIRRHPHVFGGATPGTAKELHLAWEGHKAAERADKGTAEQGVMAGLTTNLPALSLAVKAGKKAAAIGFDWENPGQVLDKVYEELDELAEADTAGDQNAVAEELGDLLLAVTNLARHLEVDPEQALRNANRKFIQRFQKLEKSLQQSGDQMGSLTLDELEARWQAIKSGQGSTAGQAQLVD